MRTARNLALLAGLIAVAMGFAVFGGSSRVAQADSPPAAVEEGLLVVHKHCLPAEVTGTFTVNAVVAYTAVGGETVPAPPEVAPFTIDCGDDSSTEADDGDTVVSDTSSGPLGALIDWVRVNRQNIATFSVTLMETDIPGVATVYDDNGIGTTASCVFDEDNFVDQLFTTPQEPDQDGLWCLITNTFPDPNVTITKVFDGDPGLLFTFAYTGEGCSISIEGGAVDTLDTGETFQLAGGETASLYCFPAPHTFTEADPSPDATFESAACTPAEGWTEIPLGVQVTTVLDSQVLFECTFTNTAGEADTLDIVVKKECVGVEGTFTINVGGAATDLSQDVACGDFVTFADLEPGSYTVEEVLDEVSGGGGGSGSCTTACNICADPCAEAEGGIVTTIACSDLQQVEGTSVTVELVDVDIFCVFINSEEDLGNLLCGCLNLDLEIDNDNTNTIGIDNDNTNTNDNANNNENENENKNENKNDNVNTNTQNQENAQDQDNTNEQTNNITSSPEVNIDFD